MPNWCNNYLELEHEDPAMIERAKKAFNEGKLLEEFIPVPASLHIVAGRVGDPDEQKKLEQAEQDNLNNHNYKNWYDFCVNEWGTKWDVGGADGYINDIEGGVMLTFESAWAPPLNAYEKMLALGFKIHATYFEGGMMFAGDWDNGIDDYYELGDMSSEEIQEELPEHLDEAYGISEMKAEWEDEEAADQED